MNYLTTLWSAKRRRTGLATPLVLAVFALPGHPQAVEWLKQVGTSQDDRAFAVSADLDGGTFVAGETEGNFGGPNAGQHDAWLARYDSSGGELWVRQLGSTWTDSALTVATTTDGGAVVGGWTFGDLATPNAGLFDAWLARFDSGGAMLWIRQLGGPLGDSLRDVITLPDGEFFVIGYTESALGQTNYGGTDVWIARFSSSGDMLWLQQFGTPADDYDNKIIFDGAGGVIACGSTAGDLAAPHQGEFDVWIGRFDGAGQTLWLQQFGTAADDLAYAAATDGQGGAFIGGKTRGDLASPSAGWGDAWLSRYDNTGQRLWITQFGTAEEDLIEVATSDAMGGVIIGGSTFGSLGGSASGGVDSWLGRYTSEGKQVWLEQVGTPAYDYTQDMTLDTQMRAVVVGSTLGALGGQYWGGTDAWVGCFDISCTSGTSYCTASSTSLPGCQASIAGSGSPSLSAPNDYLISSGSIPGGNLGICLIGANGSASIPFGTLGGVLCVQPPFFRTPPKAGGGLSGQCDGIYNFLLLELITASPVVVAGNTLHAQVWARDPANPDGFLLSDGIEFTVCP
jgi:hypothetical protein